MIVYKKKTQPIFRYALAITVFTLGLTLAVVDVYGLQMPYGQKVNNSNSDYFTKQSETESIDDTTIDITTETNDNQNPGDDTNPTSVPEPSTIILLASGLGLLRLANKKK